MDVLRIASPPDTAEAVAPIPLVDLAAQYDSIRAEIDDAIRSVLGQGTFVGGPIISEFEEAFAHYCGVPMVVGVANGTDALELILTALGVGSGDEVLVPTMTFAATAEAVVRVGARPVFVDCLPDTLNMDVNHASNLISGTTKAIIAVHLYGQPADLDALGTLAVQQGVTLIEDAAQAHGARWRGRRVGTFGRAACFSFYPGKNLGAYGDAGAVATREEDVARKVRMLANHGRSDKYVHALAGRNSRLDTVQAAILSVKLRHLDVWTARRRALADRYRQQLCEQGIRVVQQNPQAESVYHLFVVLVDRRDAVRERLRAAGISTGVHYPMPLHRQPAFAPFAARSARQTWAVDHIAPRLLSLPMYPELDESDVDRVAQVLMDAAGGSAGG
jgi:dTDP-4-amino-4,6-dideoxygalactose transaminase